MFSFAGLPRTVAVLRRSWVSQSVGVAFATLVPFVALAETCGLQQIADDVIFMNGYDPAPTDLGSAAATVVPPTLGVTPTITITYPTGSTPLSSSTIDVQGTYTGPTHTGITVNGKVAYVQNGSFLVPDVAVDQANLSLNVVATTLDELNASATLGIQAPAQTAPVTLLPDANIGLAPFKIDFGLRIDPSIPVQTVSVDFDGDGNIDATTTNPNVIPGHNYTTPGIYRPNVIITTGTPQIYTVERRIMVLDPTPWRDRLCQVYSHLRTQMSANQPANSLLAFAPEQRSKYQALFNAMGGQLPTAATQLGTLATGLMGPESAYFTLVKPVNGKLEGYPLEFAPDEKGVWRIRGM